MTGLRRTITATFRYPGLEVIARFDGPPGAALPLGLRMLLHIDRP